MANPADPWSIDYFAPPTPKVHAPAPRARAPKLLPEVNDLFTVQRHALDVLHDIADLEARLHGHEDKHVHALLRRLERNAENTYRVIRSYLATYADSTGGIQ